MAEEIPLVDFSDYSVDVETDAVSVDHEKLTALGEEICTAFTQIGFCYLTNHGINETLVKNVFSVSKEFFNKPVTIKEKYARPMETGDDHGWVATEREKLNPDRPVGDLKETYNFKPADDVKTMPTDLIPNFKTVNDELFFACTELCYRVLDVMSLAMKLPTKHFLRDFHQHINVKGKNYTTLRSLYYPRIPDDVKPGQVRCGEHSDYGTLTFLFQDNVGGLEVCNTKGTYIQAKPIEGALIVNIGDLMQRWTADKMLSTRHRVLIPEEEIKKKTERQSVAFFMDPDTEAIIECLDNSQKYEPISCLDYLKMKFGSTYLVY